MASVQRRVQLGRVSYRAVWRESGVGGKSRLRNKSFDKAADAKAYANKMEAQAERRGIADPQRQTTGGYLTYWLQYLRDRNDLSPTTLDAYARAVEQACTQIGDVLLHRLTAAHLDAAYIQLRKTGGKPRGKSKAARPLTGRSVLNVHRVLHVAFKQAKRWKLISENPAADAKAPTPEKSKARAFTVEEVKRLLAEAAREPETHAIVGTLMTCGLRRSELLGLAADALELDAARPTLTVKRVVLGVNHQPIMRDKPKSKSSGRTLEIPASLVALLRAQLVRVRENTIAWGAEYRRQPLLLFPGVAGAPMVPQTLTDRLKWLLKRANVTKAQPCHAWRHFAATALLDAGHNIKTVQNRLGHSSPAITLNLYTHPVAERDSEASEHFGKLIDWSADGSGSKSG